MFGRFLALFTIIPLVELFLLIRIGGIIGAVWTVLLVVGTGALGAYLARQQGWHVWNDIQIELQLGRFPADRLLDGLLLLVAGAVLITPGVLTDVLGLLLLIPVTRAPIKGWVAQRLRRMLQNGNVTVGGFWGGGGHGPHGGPRDGLGPGARPRGGPHDGSGPEPPGGSV